jgi:TonB family protein
MRPARLAAAAGSGGIVSFRRGFFAWEPSPEDEQRFRKILRNVGAVCALLCLLFLLWPRPQEDRAKPAELPPRIAKLVLEQQPPPPAPKPAAVQAPKVEKEAAPKEQAAPEAPKPKPEPIRSAAVPEARTPKPNRPPGEDIQSARRKAQGVGLFASKDLQQLALAPTAVQLNQNIKPGPGIGSGTGVGVGAGTDPGIPTRALITSNATGGSGGINVAAYSRDTGGGGLAGRGTTLVEGAIGGGGGGGKGGGLGIGGKGDGAGTGKGGAGGTLNKGSSGKASRSIEEIKLVFERNKGAIYAIYNRALRDEPGLQGKVVLSLTIAPSGEVTNVKIVSSELRAEELERKLLARIRAFDFGSKDVDTMVVSWPVDFLPS